MQAFNVPFDKIVEFKPRYQIEGSEVEGMELEHEAEVHENEDVLIGRMSERVDREA